MACILIIDDDIQILKLLREMLKREGHKVVEAPDGKKGIRLFKENGADLILTDIIMPEKDGLETIMELRKDSPNVKIIAISGGGRIEAEPYLNMAKQFGALRTLRKPFQREELLQAVGELLEQKIEFFGIMPS